MGFTPAPIFAPNVPDKLDPIRYLTTAPETKAQEQAQAQAQALAYGKLHGMSPSELERIVSGSELKKSLSVKPLSREEQQALQEAKTAKIPTRIEPPPETPSTVVDYPYLFTCVRVRSAYQSLEAASSRGQFHSREHSNIGTRKATVVTPSLDELELGSKYIEVIRDELAKHGLVKMRPPYDYVSARVPFGSDLRAFKTKSQAVLTPNASWDYTQMKRGFLQALIRYHTSNPGKRKLVKLPTLERRPVDFYRMFMLVEQRGGADHVARRKEWAQVSRELGFSTNIAPTMSSASRHLYLRILQPFRSWLSEQLPKDWDFNVLVRLGVDDEGKSSWHRLPFGIVIDLESPAVSLNDRRIVEFDAMRHVPAHSTLRTFRQKYASMDATRPSIPNLESEFLALPEYYGSERISPKPKLYKPSRENMQNFTSEPQLDHELWDPWDLTALSLRQNTSFYPYIVDQDLDELVVPEIDVGSRFATQQWYHPQSGAYEVNMIVDGNPRTWYTKDGVWIDQHPGEYVLVDPNAEVMNWCHGYSVMATVHVLLDSNWLIQALKRDETENTHVCIQQIAYEVANTKQPVDSAVKAQVLEALAVLKQRELKLVHDLAPLNMAPKRVAPDHTPIVCAQTGKRRFFSWALVNGEPWSLEAVRETFVFKKAAAHPVSSGPKINGKEDETVQLRFVSKYEDATVFYDKIIADVEAVRACEPQEWKEAVNKIFVQQSNRLPKPAELESLIKDASWQFRAFTEHMQEAISKLEAWMAPETAEEPEDSKVSRFNRLVECSNEAVEAEHRKFVEKAKVAEVVWQKLSLDIKAPGNDGVDVDAIMAYSTELLTQHHELLSPKVIEGLTMLQAAIDWVAKTVEALNDPISKANVAKLEVLKAQGEELTGLDKSQPAEAIERRIHQAEETGYRLDMILNEPNCLSANAIVQFRTMYINKLGLETCMDLVPAQMAKFLLLEEHTDLFQRMEAPSVLERPKRSSLAALSEVPSVQTLVSQLDAWLHDAKELDWTSIATQLTQLVEGSMLPPRANISIQQIVQVYGRLFELRCVPDDVESVVATFANTIQRLTTTPLAVLQRHGFWA